jgi:hypothetical protein
MPTKRNKTTKSHVVKSVSTTRCRSHYTALNVVIKCHEVVINTLNYVKQDVGCVDALVGSTYSDVILRFSKM